MGTISIIIYHRQYYTQKHSIMENIRYKITYTPWSQSRKYTALPRKKMCQYGHNGVTGVVIFFPYSS